jgi:O-antigen ligase
VLVTVLILLGIKYKKSNEDSLLQILKNKKILFILFLFGIIVFFQFKNEKFVDLVNLNERSSLSSRIMIWKSAARMIEDNFWWGIGAGNFQEKYLEYQKYYPLYLEWAVPHPHSLYLTFWLYGGIIGLTGFLALIFQYSKGMFRMIKKEKDNELILVSLGIMLVILIHGFIDTTYFKNDLAIVFWLVFLVFKK